MALSIKNPETEELVRQVAKITGESLTEAIQTALKERLKRLEWLDRPRRHLVREQIDDILRRVDALPVLDPRSPDEIIGYDEHGIPR